MHTYSYGWLDYFAYSTNNILKPATNQATMAKKEVFPDQHMKSIMTLSDQIRQYMVECYNGWPHSVCNNLALGLQTCRCWLICIFKLTIESRWALAWFTLISRHAKALEHKPPLHNVLCMSSCAWDSGKSVIVSSLDTSQIPRYQLD